MNDAQKPVQIKTREDLSSFIEDSLRELEAKHDDFVTLNSLKANIKDR